VNDLLDMASSTASPRVVMQFADGSHVVGRSFGSIQAFGASSDGIVYGMQCARVILVQLACADCMHRTTLHSTGECVFHTGMTGYVEMLSDASYHNQILVLAYPLIGNYGVPDSALDASFQSHTIHPRALVCVCVCLTLNHASEL
jgi:hypothetical protein